MATPRDRRGAGSGGGTAELPESGPPVLSIEDFVPGESTRLLPVRYLVARWAFLVAVLLGAAALATVLLRAVGG